MNILLQILILVNGFDCVVANPISGEDGQRNGIGSNEASSEDYSNKEQNKADYEHEAFLDRSLPKETDQLYHNLGKIVDKIDSDKDGFVSEKELFTWIKYIRRPRLIDNSKFWWELYQNSENDSFSWSEYSNIWQRNCTGYAEIPKSKYMKYEKNFLVEEKRYFDSADANKDGALSFTEFVDFKHPFHSENMADLVVTATFRDVDKNKDGFINETEYFGDTWPGCDADEPAWVKSERWFFRRNDVNKDGKLDKEEFRSWRTFVGYGFYVHASKMLIEDGDINKDGKLTKAEIFQEYEFLGEITDFGNAFSRSHDEF